jgi:hypothetical protein
MTRTKLVSALALTGALVLAVSAAAASRFGTMGQQTFQNGWKDKIYYVWERCSRFNDELDGTDTKVFYTNLHDMVTHWHWDEDYILVEDVDLFFANTHGGVKPGWARWAMWNENRYAESRYMDLGKPPAGSTSPGLSIFATHACKTHYSADGNLGDRWYPPFKGGLRMALGSHGTLYSWWINNEDAERFADYLQDGSTIKNAWRDGLRDWGPLQDISVLATGVNCDCCKARKAGMTWQNYSTYNRVRGTAIGCFCWTHYTNY